MEVWSHGRPRGVRSLGLPPWGDMSHGGSLVEWCHGVTSWGEEWGPRGTSTMGCPQGSRATGGCRAEGAAGLQGGGGCPCQGGGCLRGTEAPRKAPHGPSLFAPPPGRYLRLRPRGFLRPLPGGPALPAAAAPLLQRQPAPAAPGRLPLAPPAAPASSLFFQAPSPSPSPARWSGSDVPFAASGTPAMPPHAPRRPQPKKSRGAGRGSPAERGPGRCPPDVAPSRPLGLGKWRRCPPPATPHPPRLFF